MYLGLCRTKFFGPPNFGGGSGGLPGTQPPIRQTVTDDAVIGVNTDVVFINDPADTVNLTFPAISANSKHLTIYAVNGGANFIGSVDTASMIEGQVYEFDADVDENIWRLG